MHLDRLLLAIPWQSRTYRAWWRDLRRWYAAVMPLPMSTTDDRRAHNTYLSPHRFE